MQKGTVKWFSAGKGFGFIQSEGKDYFIHFKEIQTDGYKTLNENDHVEFLAMNSPKGPVATQVTVIND